MGRCKEGIVFISDNVEVVVNNHTIVVKGGCGTLSLYLHSLLNCKIIDKTLIFTFSSKRRRDIDSNKALLGTTCSLVRSMLLGVTVEFTKKLQLIGVGYRVVVIKNIVSLTVGFSHVINYKLPNGISVDCPTPSDIIIYGINKQLVGQVAADLRAIRPPEPFSGKGIRYLDEVLRIKEVRKK